MACLNYRMCRRSSLLFHQIRFINTGVMCFQKEPLFQKYQIFTLLTFFCQEVYWLIYDGIPQWGTPNYSHFLLHSFNKCSLVSLFCVSFLLWEIEKLILNANGIALYGNIKSKPNSATTVQFSWNWWYR